MIVVPVSGFRVVPRFLALAAALVLCSSMAAAQSNSANTQQLDRLARQFRSDILAGRNAAYNQLLQSDVPNPEMQLNYMRKTGVPAYLQMHNLNAALSVRTWDVWPGGVGGGFFGLTGSTTSAGELAVWDGGGVRATHQEFGGRVTQMDGPVGLVQHSTHVAGTMVAAGVNPNARGMSYEAPLHAYEWNLDTAEMATAAANGLQISNHSYGYASGWEGSRWYGDIFVSSTEDYGFGFYDDTARDFDIIAVNAPNYLICVSAGNDRNDTWGGSHEHWNGFGWVVDTDIHGSDFQNGGYDTISWTGNAKNILTVGAVNDIPGGYASPASVVQTAFSSWGPCDDGRIKPDIVANGAALTSCNSTANNTYATLSGTSMSSPSAAGSINLLAHEYEAEYGKIPRSSTLKALVINTADEAGGTDGPDYQNGWGLLNTYRAADLLNRDGHEDRGVYERTLAAGETHHYYFTVDSPQDVRLTIAWTDPAGTPVGPQLDPPTVMLVNDLDVRITHIAGGTTTEPWKLDRLNPANAATQDDNTVDNVEQIDVDTAPAGVYRVDVSHKAVLAGGVQDYGMVWQGMRATQPDEALAGFHAYLDLAGSDPTFIHHTSGGYQERSVFITAIQDVAVSALGVKLAAPSPTMLSLRIYAASGTTRGALIASGVATTNHPGEIFHATNMSTLLTACQDYELVFSYQESVSVPVFQESGGTPPVIAMPYDIGGAARVRDGVLNGNVAATEVPYFLIKGTVLPPVITDLTQPAFVWGNVTSGPDVTGMYVQALLTTRINSVIFPAGFPAFAPVTMHARVYESVGLTRGALIAEGYASFSNGASTAVAPRTVPLNAVLTEGKEYDIEVSYPASTEWTFQIDTPVVPFVVGGRFNVLQAERNGSTASTDDLPFFSLGWSEGAGGTPHDLAKHNDTPLPSNSSASSGQARGLFVTSQVNQHVYSLGWSADVPAGEVITVRVYEASGTTRGALVSEGQALSPDDGARWHDIPVSAELDAGGEYDFEVEMTNVNSWGFWDDSLGLPYTAYGLLEVRDGEANGSAATNELVHLRMNVCNALATPVGPGTGAVPRFTLAAPYPNPISGTATIDFSLDRDEVVTINVYDVSGRRVATLLDRASRREGIGSVGFDASGLVSGIYFVKLQTPTRSVSRKITVVK